MHLGLPVAPKKSTLAYANENRPWELYQTVFQQTSCEKMLHTFITLSLLWLNWFLLEPNPAYQELSLSPVPDPPPSASS
jgi:hypothetical protein